MYGLIKIHYLWKYILKICFDQAKNQIITSTKCSNESIKIRSIIICHVVENFVNMPIRNLKN